MERVNHDRERNGNVSFTGSFRELKFYRASGVTIPGARAKGQLGSRGISDITREISVNRE